MNKLSIKSNLLLLLLAATTIFQTASAQQGRIAVKGFAKMSKEGKFQSYNFTRHAIGDNDVLIDIMYSGICHSDIHTAKGEWGPIEYPIVPGHEIAGRVSAVGKNVTKFKVGDYAGVGCMVNSCGVCEYCKQGLEQYCLKGNVGTYASKDYFHNDETTQGGYANKIVLTEKFAIKIPKNADMAKVAPLLCAGVTTYAPIVNKQVKAGDTIAVAGFGGLGHMAVQYAVKLGAKVTVFDITEAKRADALKMGAVKFVNVNNPNELKGLDNTYKVIISTIPAKYDLNMYLRMLKLTGDLVILGFPAIDNLPTITSGDILFAGRRKISGSLIGSIQETQEMIDYSIANNIYPQVEVLEPNPAKIDEAYKKVVAGEVRYRYVIDMTKVK
jgi:uncharacterized zinc-type alcohol dehydrogenase-like protein